MKIKSVIGGLALLLGLCGLQTMNAFANEANLIDESNLQQLQSQYETYEADAGLKVKIITVDGHDDLCNYFTIYKIVLVNEMGEIVRVLFQVKIPSPKPCPAYISKE